MAYLIFSTRQGREIGRRPLNGPMLIGRSPECDVALDDGQLSRRHCRLMPSAHGWVLSDLDSRNGTKFRGHRISSLALRDGQVFQIGLVNVIFRAAEMVTGEERQDGLVRPKRPADPFAAPAAQDGTAVAFRYDTPPSMHRDVEGFPIPLPIAADLDWLDVSDELQEAKDEG
jgi:pSer/pThr/pTyr-binding forkhead associated (FHA) protein